MKVYDILHESVDFHAATIEKQKDGTKLISPHGWRQEKIDCPMCDGEGDIKYQGKDKAEQCRFCKGSGKSITHVSDSPELNVSNSNARAIIVDILGKEFDYSGMISNKELPALQRKLVGMLNSEGRRSSMHKDTTDNEQDRKMQHTGTKDTVAHIGRGGPRMVDMGRSDDQVKRYAKALLDIVVHAQKHNLIISWA